jgi:heme-degrading monooxygenase HmoA
MHARLSTYRSDDADGLLEGFESVTGDLEHVDGFSGAYFLLDRQSGKAASITLWDSEAALLASVAQADELRERGASAGGASIESVDHFEVVLTAGKTG